MLSCTSGAHHLLGPAHCMFLRGDPSMQFSGLGSFGRPAPARRVAASASPKSTESSEEAFQRRLRESQRVEERVEVIYNEQEFEQELEKVRLWPAHALHGSTYAAFCSCVPLQYRSMLLMLLWGRTCFSSILLTSTAVGDWQMAIVSRFWAREHTDTSMSAAFHCAFIRGLLCVATSELM